MRFQANNDCSISSFLFLTYPVSSVNCIIADFQTNFSMQSDTNLVAQFSSFPLQNQ